MQNSRPGLLRAMQWQKANFLTCAMQEANWEETTTRVDTESLRKVKAKCNFPHELSFRFVARFNISTAQVSYFSPRCRRSWYWCRVAPCGRAGSSYRESEEMTKIRWATQVASACLLGVDFFRELERSEKDIRDIFLPTINRFQRKSTFSSMYYMYKMIQAQTLIGLDGLKK